jgi:hypothetical protein
MDSFDREKLAEHNGGTARKPMSLTMDAFTT